MFQNANAITERGKSAERFAQLDRETVRWLGVTALVLVLGIVGIAAITGKPIDAGLTTLAASVISFIGGRLTRNRQDLPPGTATVTPPAVVKAATPTPQSIPKNTRKGKTK